MAWQRPLATVSRAVSCGSFGRVSSSVSPGSFQSVSTVLVLPRFSLHCRQTTLSLQFCIQNFSPSSGLRAALRSSRAGPALGIVELSRHAKGSHDTSTRPGHAAVADLLD